MRVPIILFVALLLGGCGYGPPRELACNDLARAICAKRVECSSGRVFPHVFADLSTCIAREQALCVAADKAPGNTRTALDTEACALSFPGTSCADFSTSTLGSACPGSGSRGNGEACAFGTQCASAYCQVAKSAACGTCSSAPVPGAPCTSFGCARGQTCVTATGTCLVPTPVGGTCATNASSCAVDLVCVSAAGTTGSCQPAQDTIGATCGTEADEKCDDTRSLFCQGTAALTCEIGLEVSDGQPCGALANGNFALCSLGGTCDLATGSMSGTCRAAAPDGGACDVAVGPPCLTPARCVVPSGSAASVTAGTCMIPDGASCG